VDQLGLSARLHMVQSTANALRAQDSPRWNPSPLLNAQWAKCWLDRQPDLFKAKRKPLAAERKNAHDPEVLQTHFDEFEEEVVKYGITEDDTWNFDETGYRMGIARSDWVVTVDSIRRIYSKDPDNRESLTGIECISGGGYGSHHTSEFLSYCEDHKIIPLRLTFAYYPSASTARCVCISAIKALAFEGG